MSVDLRPYYRTQRRGKLNLTYVSWADLCHAVNHAGLSWHWDIELLTVGDYHAVKGKLTVWEPYGERFLTRCALAPIDFNSPGGNPWEEAESAAFRRAWAKFNVGLELWRGKDATVD